MVELPVPPGSKLLWLRATKLLQTADGDMAFAVPAAMPSGDSDVVLYMREGGRWSYIPLGVTAAAYAAIGLDDRDGIVISVVRPDAALPVDGNSLFLHSTSDARGNRRIVLGGMAPIHEPVLTRTVFGLVASYWVQTGHGREARAYFTASDRTRFLDSSITHLDAVSTRNGIVWIAQVATGRNTDARLHFIAATRQLGRRTIGNVPDYFQGPFKSVLASNGDLILFGPLLVNTGNAIVLATLQVSYRITCTEAPNSTWAEEE